jgi:cation diffusion facilitator family transporter
MSDCGCHGEPAHSGQRRILWIALGLNAAMALVEALAGLRAQSTGLLADALDMLSDAGAYAIALAAIGRSQLFKARSAAINGAVVLLLGLGVLVEVGRRAIYGSEPQSAWMIGIAALALAVNLSVLWMLRPIQQGEVHLRATWICTRADVVANAGVIVSGVLVAATGFRIADLIVAAAIGVYVIKEAIEILREARDAGAVRSVNTVRGEGES